MGVQRLGLKSLYSRMPSPSCGNVQSKSWFSTSRRVLNNNTNTSSLQTLTWPEFFELRKKRRSVNVACSVVTAFMGVGVGWGIMSNIEFDPTQMFYGVEIGMILGIGVVLCGVLGYLAGPSLGNVVFRQVIRKDWQSFSHKNYEFLKRIEKNRPDPSSQSYSNPIPDYYGEKISSLGKYREWLRDNYRYKQKQENFL